MHCKGQAVNGYNQCIRHGGPQPKYGYYGRGRAPVTGAGSEKSLVKMASRHTRLVTDGRRIVNEPEAPASREDAARDAALDTVDEVSVKVGALAAAMRMVGAGRARLGDLELDLTCPPAALVQLPGEFAQDNETAMLQREREAEARADKRDGVLFAAGGKQRMKLPLM